MNPILLRVLAFSAIAAALIITGYLIIRPADELPVYHPKQINPRLVDKDVWLTEGEHRISDFALIDQRGDTITKASIAGRIVVADFFFTTCPTICPKMTKNLERVQQAYAGDRRLVILSHSVTPEMDSVPVLAAYAELHGADPQQWHFLTGERKQIYALARRSYFACLDEGDGGLQDFVHTENIVLVDPRGRLRGFYDGTNPKETDDLIRDIKKLLRELKSDSSGDS
ncbi:MAG: SCO family protein [Flavobacteriales bacterium]